MLASRFVRELFKNPRTISAIVPPAPAEGPGGGSPRGGCLLYVQHWRVCPVVFWRVVWYLRGRDRINVVPVVPVMPVVPGHAWPPCPWLYRGYAAAAAGIAVFCRYVVVATRRWMLVFAMVLAWSVLA